MLEGILLLMASITLVIALSALLKLRHNSKSAFNRLREEREYMNGNWLHSQQPGYGAGDEASARQKRTVKLHLVADKGDLFDSPED